jgi:hypothetical protein
MFDRFGLERHRKILVLGLLLFTPAVLLALTVAFLFVAQSIVLADLSTVELVELYLIELVVFTAFAYLLYRVTRVAVTEHLPEADGDDRPPEEARRGDDAP